jgi:CheY-like chemotaxis protein
MHPRDDRTPRRLDPNCDPGLIRIRSVARAISERVHQTLGHYPTPPPVVAAAGAPLRVLVVDDNPDAADALAAVAELLGCEARACYGGAEAIDALHAELPDVLLLDLSMPRVTGLEVASRARAMAGGRPLLVAATTALGTLEARTATAMAGFHFHLVKPVTTADLRAVLDQFRALRRSPPRAQPSGG